MQLAHVTTPAAAAKRGFTREILAFGGGCDLNLLIQPEADLDCRFVAFCCDENELIRVNGWLFQIEDA